ncbi:MAG TPA: hypothetical protein VJ725_34675 [Thermoanaerobaculia bacterium]|nr:hypothetical protein [Thermoanaerobaculia bacterium]
MAENEWNDDDPALDELDGPGGEPTGQDDDAEIYGSDEPEPQPKPAAPQLPLSNQPAIPQALQPLYDRLPAGWKSRIIAGTASVEQAIASHYQTYNVQVDRFRQKADGAEQRALATERKLEKLIAKFGEQLGIDLSDPDPNRVPSLEEDPNAHLADKLGTIEEQLAEMRAMEEDRRLDVVVDQQEQWVQSDAARVEAEYPFYREAEAFLADRLLDKQRQFATEALMFKDYRIFPREYLEAAAQGLMTGEELVERTAVERAMDVVAHLRVQHHQSGKSLAMSVLQNAVRLGFEPSILRQETGAQPVAGQHQPARPTNPRIQRVQNTLRNGSSTPLPAAPQADLAQRLLTMSEEEFNRAMDEAEDPDALFRALLRARAVPA